MAAVLGVNPPNHSTSHPVAYEKDLNKTSPMNLTVNHAYHCSKQNLAHKYIFWVVQSTSLGVIIEYWKTLVGYMVTHLKLEHFIICNNEQFCKFFLKVII